MSKIKEHFLGFMYISNSVIHVKAPSGHSGFYHPTIEELRKLLPICIEADNGKEPADPNQTVLEGSGVLSPD